MKSLTNLLALFHLINHCTFVAAVLDVKCNNACTCINNETITCPPGVQVSFTRKLNDYEDELTGVEPFEVVIKCDKLLQDLSVLTGLNLSSSGGYSSVVIDGCYLPNSSLSETLGRIGVRDFENLKITSYNGSLERKHFESLDKVEDLIIAQSDLGVLLEDVFEGLVNLVKFKLESSSFALREGIFQNTPKLQLVSLINNTVSDLSFEMFNNVTSLRSVEIVGNNDTFIAFDETKQFISPALNYFQLSSVAIRTLSHVLESESNRTELPLEGNSNEVLPFQEILKNTKIYKVEMINIRNSALVLHPGCFANLPTLSIVTISENNLTHVPEHAFSRSKGISFLVLSENLIETFEENTFFDLEKLRSLDLRHNRISYLPERLFSRTTDLWNLNLSYNLLENIEPNLFLHQSELGFLYLSHNKLRHINGEQFSHLSSVLVIDLSHNQLLSLALDPLLSDLDQSVFYNCTQLTELNLQNNSLTEIYDDWRLLLDNGRTTLNLTDNQITDIQSLPEKDVRCPAGCRCVYRPVTRSSVVNCQNAELQTYPRALPLFPGADHSELTLYGNALREFRLPDDPGYKNITFLNLANNSLSSVDITGVSKKLKKLDVSGNELETLSEEALELLEDGLLELERLELWDNPWTCDVTNLRLANLVSVKRHLIRHNVTCEDGSSIESIRDLQKSTCG